MTAQLQNILPKLRDWMADYAHSFYTDDPEVQLGIKLKEEHTGYVTAHARDLAAHLGLDEYGQALAEIIGMFHDVGRFRQYTIYKTFNDSRSEDHADLGLKVLDELQILSDLNDGDLRLVRFAIGNHNKRFIAPTADEREILFAKIIRDADKLDIYRVLAPFLTGQKAKEAPNFVTSSDSDEVSPDFIRHFMNGEQADYREIRTQGDRRLVRLLWVYDVYFSWTMRKIVAAGYIEKIIDELKPHTPEMQAGIERLNRYVADKCEGEDTLKC